MCVRLVLYKFPGGTYLSSIFRKKNIFLPFFGLETTQSHPCVVIQSKCYVLPIEYKKKLAIYPAIYISLIIVISSIMYGKLRDVWFFCIWYYIWNSYVSSGFHIGVESLFSRQLPPLNFTSLILLMGQYSSWCNQLLCYAIQFLCSLHLYMSSSIN